MIETWSQQQGTGSPNTWTFGYDRAQQLTAAVLKNATGGVLQNFSYGYDQAGNRTREQFDRGSPAQTSADRAIHNANNQVTDINPGSGPQSTRPVRFSGELNEGGTMKVNSQPARMGVNDEVSPSVSTFEAVVDLNPGLNIVTVEAKD